MHWTLRSELVKSMTLAARQPRLCGLDLVDILWLETPGTAALPTGIPIYVNRAANIPRDHDGYNVAISEGNVSIEGYRKVDCFVGSADMSGSYRKQACVWRRDGGCVQGVASSPVINWPPIFSDSQGHPRWDRIRPYLLQGH
jgi:hypothetical protein